MPFTPHFYLKRKVSANLHQSSFNKTKCINQFDNIFVYQRYTRRKFCYFPVIKSSFVFAILINKRLQTNNFVCNLYEQEYSYCIICIPVYRRYTIFPGSHTFCCWRPLFVLLYSVG